PCSVQPRSLAGSKASQTELSMASPSLGSGLAVAPSTTSTEEPAMNRNRQETAHRWVFLAIFGDFLMALLGSMSAFWLRFNTLQSIGHFTDLEARQYLAHQILGSTSLIAVLAWYGIYRSNMLLQSSKVTRRITKATILWTGGFLLLALTFETSPPISRIYMALNGIITLALLLAWRRYFDARLRHPTRLAVLQQRTVLVGWSEDTKDLAAQFNGNAEHALKIVGWVETSDEASPVRRPIPGVPCLGHVDDLAHIVSANPSDMVILTDLSGPRARAVEIANLCEREMVQFKIIPSCFRVFISGLQLETVGGTPILGVSQLPLDSSFNVLMKRGLDILGSIFGLLVSAPLIALFGALVWLESRGPIFYRQRRTGANGKTFEIIKIRSMKLNAETNGAQWCVADDPRRLRVGAFMRKWNIDELPQFWNVLKGEMSLVGPRPERPELIANFKHQIPHYNARHHAKPGMTGWAAIKGLRGDTDLTERIVADLWYLEHWSLLLDVQIMLMTFSRRENAY
ncbi:MAG: hypothetical protein JWO08_4002, partial [Verrucomicrobiaceae bacterium]|nr:hypothetical protein [Verrucomicrobiaceae bacterium]